MFLTLYLINFWNHQNMIIRFSSSNSHSCLYSDRHYHLLWKRLHEIRNRSTFTSQIVNLRMSALLIEEQTLTNRSISELLERAEAETRPTNVLFIACSQLGNLNARAAAVLGRSTDRLATEHRPSVQRGSLSVCHASALRAMIPAPGRWHEPAGAASHRHFKR